MRQPLKQSAGRSPERPTTRPSPGRRGPISGLGGGVVLMALSLALGCGRDSGAEPKLPPATGPEAPPRKPLPDVSAAKPAATQVASSAQETTGTTFPRAQAQIAPNMSGVIAQILVDEGDAVKKGQVLFRLRTADFALGVKQAEAALKSAEVGLAAVKVEYDRTQRLVEQGAVNQAAWDRVKAQYESAQAGVEQARVGLSMARKAMADATVRSPISGVVTQKLKNEGEMATMMPPSPILVVEDHSTLELRFRLPERAIPELDVGDAVRAEFASLGTTADAKVLRISPSVDPATRTFEVIAELPNADGKLKAGMLARVTMPEATP